MQTHLSAVCGEEISLSTIFPAQPTAAQRADERENGIQQDIWDEINDKKERIKELRKEIGDDEEALLNAELDEIDAEPDEGEEVIFEAVAPMLEEDLNYVHHPALFAIVANSSNFYRIGNDSKKGWENG
jgi:hypothetical protein